MLCLLQILNEPVPDGAKTEDKLGNSIGDVFEGEAAQTGDDEVGSYDEQVQNDKLFEAVVVVEAGVIVEELRVGMFGGLVILELPLPGELVH